MNINFFHSGPAESLGWTLLHFTWQGTVLAIQLKLALGWLPRASAQARYLAGCGALVAAGLCPLVTFAILQQPRPAFDLSAALVRQARTDPVPTAGVLSDSPDALIRVAVQRRPQLVAISVWLEARLPWVLLVWAGGVLLCSIRLAVGWWQVQRLARERKPLPQLEWEDCLRRAAQRLHLTRAVTLAQSALVRVPTALGWLRPMILLPVTSLTSLLPAEIEAILAHELAHVSRHDYLVNLLQSLVETLLFYHPAVWWISGQIRREREHACDDLVVAAYGDRVSYARALANLEGLCEGGCERLALSAAGGSLLERVQRLLGKPARHRSSAGWMVSLAVPAAFALWLLTERNVPAAGSNPPATAARAGQDLAPATPGSVANVKKAVQVTIETKFTEVSQADMKAIGLSWILDGVPSDSVSDSQTLQITNRNGIISQPALDAKGKMVGELFDNPGLRNLEQVSPGVARTLTEAQFRVVMRALEQRSGADVLAAPRVTTLSGLQAKIEVIELKEVVTGVSITTDSENKNRVNYITSVLPTGPAVDLLPEVSADEKMIRLSVSPSWTEFLGYDEPKPVVVQGLSPGKKPEPLKVQRPLPHFQVRQTLAKVNVHDGQTIVLSGFGDLPRPSKMSKVGKPSQVNAGAQRQLIIFVTPVLVDPAGNRVNPE